MSEFLHIEVYKQHFTWIHTLWACGGGLSQQKHYRVLLWWIVLNKGPPLCGKEQTSKPTHHHNCPNDHVAFPKINCSFEQAPPAVLSLWFNIFIFYFSSTDLNVNIYYQILSITQRPSLLPSDFQWTFRPLHALRVITFPFSWHQLQLIEQIFQRLSTRLSTSKSDPEHKTPRKEMLFLNHSVILQQIWSTTCV